MKRNLWYSLFIGCLFLLLTACGTELGKQSTTSLSSSSPSQKVTVTPTSGAIQITVAKKQATAQARKRPTPTPVPTSAPTLPTPTPTTSTSGGTTQLPASAESQLVQQLFDLINQDRASAGLPAYKWNDALAQVSRAHTEKMLSCGLSHACPDEPNPCTRVKNAGIAWMTCGENVGYSSSRPDAWGGAKKVHEMMITETPPNDGHRRNLLSSAFHQIGIGIIVDSKGLVWITEDFIN